MVRQTEGVFTFDQDNLAAPAKSGLFEERQSYIPSEDLDEKSKKVLRAHLNPDGSIRQIPAVPKLQVILNYLIQFFEFEQEYTEREVNTILKKYHEDRAGLRRDLVDAKLLARESDGSRYWRVKTGLS